MCIVVVLIQNIRKFGAGGVFGVRGAEVLAGGLANTYRPMFSEVEKYRRDRGLTV